MYKTSTFYAPHSRRPRNPLVYVLSPTFFSLLALFLCVASYLIPKDLYEYATREVCLYCGGYEALLFYFFCTMSFIAGAKALDFLSPSRNLEGYCWREAPPKISAIMLVTVPVIVLLLNLYSFMVIVSNTPDLIGNMLSGQAAAVKDSLNTEGALSNSQPLLICVLAWLSFRYRQHKDLLSPQFRTFIFLLIVGGTLESCLISLAKAARYELIPLFLQMAIIHSYCKSKTSYVPLYRILIYMGVAGTGILSIFLAMSYLRGFDRLDLLLGNFFGYGPASFNHLESELTGQLQFPYGGTGAYSITFMSFIPLFENIFHIRDFFGLPDIKDVFLSEFLATSAAGLNGEYIWVTAFGYYYFDLGNYVFPFLFFQGLFCGYCWRSFLQGRAFGIIAYPFVIGTVALWFSAHWLVQPASIVTIVTAALISALEAFSSSSSRRMQTAVLSRG